MALGTQGYGAEQLRLQPDIVVVGNALSRGSPVVEAMLDRGMAYTSGPQWLAEQVLREKHVIAVAGTHGKTTTTAMLTWILEEAGLAPGFLIGGVPNNFDSTARLGKGRSSSSKRMNTTRRFSTSARNSCTTGRSPPSSTIWNSITRTSIRTWPRSAGNSTSCCAPCPPPVESSSMATMPNSRPP